MDYISKNKVSFPYNAFIEQGAAFSDRQFCEHWRACNFYAIRLRMQISFLNDVDIG